MKSLKYLNDYSQIFYPKTISPKSLFKLNNDFEYVPLVNILNNFKYNTGKYDRPNDTTISKKHIKLLNKSDQNYFEWLACRYNSDRLNNKDVILSIFGTFNLDICSNLNWGYGSRRRTIANNIDRSSMCKSGHYCYGTWFLMNIIEKQVLLSLMVNKKDIPEIMECYAYNKEYPSDKLQMWVRLDVLKGGVFNNILLKKIKELDCDVKFVPDFKQMFGKNTPSDMTLREQKEYFNSISSAFLNTVPGRTIVNIDKLQAGDFMMINPQSAEELMAVSTIF